MQFHHNPSYSIFLESAVYLSCALCSSDLGYCQQFGLSNLTMASTLTKSAISELVPLHAAVQNYAWGLSPSEGSLVARIHALNSGLGVEEEKPYAELWMGIHPSGPARIVSNPDITLSQFLSEASVLSIPYLFKILSVAKPLSIQAHPHKHLAAKLHRENPKAYKDDNHKPEMCVALTGTLSISLLRVSFTAHFLFQILTPNGRTE